MTNKSIIVVLAFALSLLCASVVSAQEWTGNFNAFLGQKSLNDKDYWQPAEEQGEFGIEIDFRQRDWPINIAIDLMGASGEGDFFDSVNGTIDKFKSRTSEFNIGIRKIWDGTPVRPFIGGGVSFMHAEAEVEVPGLGSFTDTDDGTGFWVGGGVYFTFNYNFNLGFELKYSKADVTLENVNTDAGGTHFGLLVGYHW